MEGPADLYTRVPRLIVGSILRSSASRWPSCRPGGGFALPMCEQAIARRSKGDCEATQPMKAPDLADEAKAFSVFIECR